MSEISKASMEEAVDRIKDSTVLINTPETEERFGPNGTFYLYSVGMNDNYGMPDLEIRGVPGMFVNAAADTINEINAYRLLSEQPVLVGQRISWQHGDIITEQGDDWGGRFGWKAKDMIRLTSAETTIHGSTCECCQNEKAGITE